MTKVTGGFMAWVKHELRGLAGHLALFFPARLVFFGKAGMDSVFDMNRLRFVLEPIK